jgi:hypothetical protein
MYHTTGFTKAEITELYARIEARELSPRLRRWPPILGLRNALTVTLTYLRRNRVQAEIAENVTSSWSGRAGYRCRCDRSVGWD